MFDRTKAKVDTLINDRVTSPVRTGIIISVCAFIIAGLALVIVLTKVNDS